jgi:hypothetical protein
MIINAPNFNDYFNDYFFSFSASGGVGVDFLALGRHRRQVFMFYSVREALRVYFSIFNVSEALEVDYLPPGRVRGRFFVFFFCREGLGTLFFRFFLFVRLANRIFGPREASGSTF